MWSLVGREITEHMNQMRHPSAKLWLFAMIESLSHQGLTKMCVTLWAISYARRKVVIHEEVFQSPLLAYAFVQNFLSELQSASMERVSGLSEGSVKLNVDVAIRMNGWLRSRQLRAMSKEGSTWEPWPCIGASGSRRPRDAGGDRSP